ncbi:MAG: hypothetical protein R8M45_06945 [Ghiorsea sp.]
MLISTGDLLLSVFFTLGLFQCFWLSIVLVRKGLNPSLIRLCLTIFMSIWVLIWPAYENSMVIMFSFVLFLLPVLLALQANKPFARHLRLCWCSTPQSSQQPAPWLMLLLSLFLSVALFQQSPALGLGIALSLCLAWSAAELLDKSEYMPLGFLRNPQQTWVGHLLFLLGSALLCAWSLQLYQQIPWQSSISITLIAGLAASLTRMMLPQGWNMPLAMLGMGIVLGWLSNIL